MPVNRRIQIRRRPESRAMAGIANIDRLVLARDLEEPPLLFRHKRVVHSARRHGENDVIVLKTFSRTVAVQGIRHLSNGCAQSGLHSLPLMKSPPGPNPDWFCHEYRR